jgi:DNA repair protein RadA/Sms
MKQKTVYTCQGCGHQEPKWLGRCPSCGTWNSFVEEASVSGPAVVRLQAGDPIPLPAIESTETARLASGVEEMDRVLGGGLVRGSTVLVGGEPGIGKSTLMLQLAQSLDTKGRVLYVSGEESASQIKMRAQRLGVSSDRIEVFCQTSLEDIRRAVDRLKPTLTIVDSIQTIGSGELTSLPGTVSQVRMCAQELASDVKGRNQALFLVGHVTKEGLIAGPKVVEHLVDTVLYFDQSDSDVRFLRSIKNRFGSTDEVGIFRMGPQGLEAVGNPAALFLEHRSGDPPSGVAVAPVYEGTRVLLVEIQSLTVPAKGGISRVFSDRIDSRRVSRIGAVLEKHLKLPLSSHDIYVNVAGGLRISEVGIDLALALALYGAKTGLSIGAGTVVFGEVSLAGEIRRVPHHERRVKTTDEMGYHRIVGPRSAGNDGGDFVQVGTVAEAIRAIFAEG